MLSEVKKNPRVTAKDLKDSLKLLNISVHESTNCETNIEQAWYPWKDTTK